MPFLRLITPAIESDSEVQVSEPIYEPEPVVITEPEQIEVPEPEPESVEITSPPNPLSLTGEEEEPEPVVTPELEPIALTEPEQESEPEIITEPEQVIDSEAEQVPPVKGGYREVILSPEPEQGTNSELLREIASLETVSEPFEEITGAVSEPESEPELTPEPEETASPESEPESDEEFKLQYDVTSGKRYVDLVSTKTEFDKMLDELASISHDLLEHESEKFAVKFSSKFSDEADSEARKYEAFLGGYISNAALILYDKGYRDAALKQLDQAKIMLETKKRLEEETAAIHSRVEENNDVVDLSDILGLFGDG